MFNSMSAVLLLDGMQTQFVFVSLTTELYLIQRPLQMRAVHIAN